MTNGFNNYDTFSKDLGKLDDFTEDELTDVAGMIGLTH